jgi:hypothetical protein
MVNIPLTTRVLGPDPKNSPLTNNEVDTNFLNLKSGVQTVEASIEPIANDVALVLAIALG